ncbi:type VII secretion protein EccB [Streptomyces sp. NPDC006872]|uniref:type VII secretion protein EccB n=1 Tax=Streptomyces sp. NPDC006872 TaxID=3155720 RepID=UPI0033F2C0A3
MQTKRDQVMAHMFVMGRLTSAMLRADPDAPESPQGRTNRGVAIGIVIAVLISAGAFVFGLLKPGTSDSWRAAGTLVVSKGTGSRYLYLDGRLRPVRNYASARLLVGAELKTVNVGEASLADTPRGMPVGIPGAPDVLPGAAALDGAPWQVCSGSLAGDTAATLGVARRITGTGLGERQGLLVTGPDRETYLVWQGSRFRLDRKGNVREALGYGSHQPVAVSAAFLNALSAGPDLTPPAVPGRGGPGPELGGRPTRVGEVFTVAAPGATERYYLLGATGLTPLTATAAALVLSDPETVAKVYGGRTATAVPLESTTLAGHLAPASDATAGAGAEGAGTASGGALPATPPEPVALTADLTACAAVESGQSGTRVSVALVEADGLGPTAQGPAEWFTPACVAVGRITVPPGGGALVHALGADGSDIGATLYLVTDTGMKYRVPSADALTALGYTAAQAQDLPSSLLAMVPTGPDLSPEAATLGRSSTTTPPCGAGPGA